MQQNKLYSFWRENILQMKVTSFYIGFVLIWKLKGKYVIYVLPGPPQLKKHKVLVEQVMITTH